MDLVKTGLKASSWGRRRAGVAEGSVVIVARLDVEVQGEAKGISACLGQGRVEAWHSHGLVVALWRGTYIK